MDRPHFVPGRVYDRAQELHAPYGGQHQKGISPSRIAPVIFIFDSEQGDEYGYEDGWQPDGSFYFTGEGRSGDQKFTSGNKRLRDSQTEGRQVFLFKKISPGKYRFEAELQLIGIDWIVTKGEDHFDRNAIRFQFMPVSDVTEVQPADDAVSKDLDELRREAYEAPTTSTPKQRVALARARSVKVKRYILARAGGVCELCSSEAPFKTEKGAPFLEVHHVDLLSEDGIDLPDSAVGICPNCHREAHYGSNAGAIREQLKQFLARVEATRPD